VNIVWYFVLGFIIYSLGAFLSYTNSLKHLTYYQLLGILLGVAANFLWFSIAKQTMDRSLILRYGFYWYSIIVLSFVAIPYIFFDIRLTLIKTIGIITIATGILLTKL
jgi:multidrug transporter EmrE-like cation transporter